jgi:kynurenine formamidase
VPAAPGTAAGGTPWSEETFRDQLRAVSNWSRWGEDDTLGTLNYVTPEKIQGAAQLVQAGRRVALGRPLEHGGGRGTEPVLHFMLRTGQDAPQRGQGTTRDWAGLPLHGPDNTHLDAFGHHTWDGACYGGRPARSAVTSDGALAGDIGPAADGIVSRGVLLDMPRALGLDWIPPERPVLTRDVDHCAAGQSVQVGPGDILLVRTGRGRAPARPEPSAATRHTGLDPGVMTWLHARQVAVLGSDVDSEVRPARQSFVNSPVHALALVAMGLWLLDNADLEELAAVCAELGRWEFLCVITPLRIRRGTASPVNPLAIF